MVHTHRALADIPRGKQVLAVMVPAAEVPWEKVERMLPTAVPCTVSSSFLSLKYYVRFLPFFSFHFLLL